MSSNAIAGDESTGTTAIDELDYDQTTGKRAVYEDMELHPRDGHVLVRNASHADPADHEYRVDVADDVPTACSCPAFEYHCGPGEACKHMTAVGLAEPILDAAAPEASH